MKKILLFTAILFASITMGIAQGQIVKPNYQGKGHNNAQEGQQFTATTNLTIVLNPIQSISVNTSNVSLVYTTVNDYKNGVSSGLIPEHIKVYSTGGYKVNVGYSGVTDTNNGENSVGGLDANQMFQSINVAVTKKAFANVNDTKLQPLVATNTNGTIISSDKGVFGETFDVEYQGGANYMNSIKGGKRRVYAATVTYTITPN